jgi:hypothetical protein
MAGFGAKRILVAPHMSAFGGKADIGSPSLADEAKAVLQKRHFNCRDFARPHNHRPLSESFCKHH